MAGVPAPSRGSVLDRDYAKYGFPLRTGPKYVAQVLASDPWDYLDYWLRENMLAQPATRARALLEQARDFFDAGQTYRMSSRPLLYYYSFLNIAKVLLLANGSVLADPRHGLSVVSPLGQRFASQKIRVQVDPRKDNVFPELVARLGGKLGHSQEFRIIDVLQQVVGIHSTWSEVAGKCSCFAPVTILPVRSSHRKEVFALIILQKPWDNPDCWKAIRQRSKWTQVRVPEEFSLSQPEAELVCLETPHVRRRGTSYRSALTILAGNLRAVGVHALLTRGGYRLYVSDFGPVEQSRLPQIASIYASMFYLGSITRYQPEAFDKIIDRRWAWLVTDFLNTQPKQFLYLMASEITHSDVVIPYGQLD